MRETMKRSIVIITFVLVFCLGLSAVAYCIIEKINADSASIVVIIMILSIAPGLAVIAGLAIKMKKWRQ